MKRFSPKFRKLSNPDKIASFIEFCRSHRVKFFNNEVTRVHYNNRDDSIVFSINGITHGSVTTEKLFAAKIDGHVISGVDEFGTFKIEFFNLTPASITL